MVTKAEWVGYVAVMASVAFLTVGQMSVAASGNSVGVGQSHSTPNSPSYGGSNIRHGDLSASCGALPTLPDPDLYSDAGDAVKAMSRLTSDYLKACNCPNRACLADALDNYAQALDKVAPRLPPQIRDMPRVIAQAAHRVRAARSKVEAEAAVAAAIEHIHKEIALIRVDDADKQARLTRSGGFVVGTLETAKSALERADSL